MVQWGTHATPDVREEHASIFNDDNSHPHFKITINTVHDIAWLFTAKDRAQIFTTGHIRLPRSQPSQNSGITTRIITYLPRGRFHKQCLTADIITQGQWINLSSKLPAPPPKRLEWLQLDHIETFAPQNSITNFGLYTEADIKAARRYVISREEWTNIVRTGKYIIRRNPEWF